MLCLENISYMYQRTFILPYYWNSLQVMGPTVLFCSSLSTRHPSLINWHPQALPVSVQLPERWEKFQRPFLLALQPIIPETAGFSRKGDGVGIPVVCWRLHYVRSPIKARGGESNLTSGHVLGRRHATTWTRSEWFFLKKTFLLNTLGKWDEFNFLAPCLQLLFCFCWKLWQSHTVYDTVY